MKIIQFAMVALLSRFLHTNDSQPCVNSWTHILKGILNGDRKDSAHSNHCNTEDFTDIETPKEAWITPDIILLSAAAAFTSNNSKFGLSTIAAALCGSMGVNADSFNQLTDKVAEAAFILVDSNSSSGSDLS